MINKAKFVEVLSEKKLTDKEIVQKYLIHGKTFIFENDEDLYFDLKKEVASFFKIGPQEIFMIGSAKLGFSIAPSKLWKEFNEESDIDIVVVSDKIFDIYWQELFEFNIELTARSQGEQDLYEKFLNYFFRGWIRPDLFSFNFQKKAQWFDFFKEISYKKYGTQKITCAIFRNMFFFEKYHTSNIKIIREGFIK